jgi:hypothetical protein
MARIDGPQRYRRTGLVTVVLLGVAALVVVGSVALIHGAKTPTNGNLGPTPGTVLTGPGSSPFPTSAPIPGITAAAVVDQLVAQFGIRPQKADGYYAGNVYDPGSGIDFKINVAMANESGALGAFGCYFVKNGIVVDAKLIDKAAQCVTLGVPQAVRVEARSWLIATGPKVPNETPVHRDFSGTRLIIVRESNQFDNSVVPVPNTSASPSPR